MIYLENEFETHFGISKHILSTRPLQIDKFIKYRPHELRIPGLITLFRSALEILDLGAFKAGALNNLEFCKEIFVNYFHFGGNFAASKLTRLVLSGWISKFDTTFNALDYVLSTPLVRRRMTYVKAYETLFLKMERSVSK